MRADHWREITKIAARQAGLVTNRQLRLVGASPAAIARLVREGQLVPIRRGVLAVAGAPADDRRTARAAALASPDAVVSHRSAAWLHQLITRQPNLVDLTTQRRPIKALGVRGHQAELSPEEITDCDGIPLTSIVRTLVDLTASLPPDWLERLVHEAVMRRMCSYEDVRRAAEARTDDGGPVMTELLDEIHGSTPLEARWERILRAAGMPSPITQFQIVVDDRVYVLDFAWPDARVALEVNGFAFHSTRDAFDRDHGKVVALQAAGWNVVSATSKTPPAPVLTALRLAISTATGAVDIAG